MSNNWKTDLQMAKNATLTHSCTHLQYARKKKRKKTFERGSKPKEGTMGDFIYFTEPKGVGDSADLSAPDVTRQRKRSSVHLYFFLKREATLRSWSEKQTITARILHHYSRPKLCFSYCQQVQRKRPKTNNENWVILMDLLCPCHTWRQTYNKTNRLTDRGSGCCSVR